MSVIELQSVEQYTELTQSGKPVVVDFTASWCGPCKFIAPEFAKLAQEFQNVTFVKVDVDTFGNVDTNIAGVPTFVFFKDGSEVTRFSGANVQKLRDNLALISK